MYDAEAAVKADLIILAVKPWKLKEVIDDLKPVMDYSRQAVASVAGGVGLGDLSALLDKGDGQTLPIYYIIPNTAASVGESMTFISSANASAALDAEVVAIFGELGSVRLVEEKLMNPGMVLASCGIAFAMRYIRAATEAGVELGFYASDAQKTVMQTMKGAVALLEKSGSHPEVEIDRVTTPGGLTIKGLNEMEANGFTTSVIEGVKKAMPK